jgi:hypothetical protein
MSPVSQHMFLHRSTARNIVLATGDCLLPRNVRAARIHLFEYEAEGLEIDADLRENESVSVEPVWVLGVEGHEFVEQNMGRWGQAHGGARMAGVGFEGGIDLFDPVSAFLHGEWGWSIAQCRCIKLLTSVEGKEPERTYCEESNGVDGLPVCVCVAHDGDFVLEIGGWKWDNGKET